MGQSQINGEHRARLKGKRENRGGWWCFGVSFGADGATISQGQGSRMEQEDQETTR